MKGCAKYSAGQLREVVAFQRQVRAADGVGGATLTWAAISGAPTRAYVRQVSGSEAYRFDRINAEVRLMVVTRYVATITPGDRVLIRGKAHNITAINNVDFADDWLEIGVTGGVAT